LSDIISGIVCSRHVHLPAIAKQIPDGATVDSRVKCLSRWINYERIDLDVYYLS